jgi:hypothetical protein
LYRTAADPYLGLAAHQAAAIQALDLHAENLGVLNKCRQEYGCIAGVDDVFREIEEWATLGPTDRARHWDYFAVGMKRGPASQGDNWNSWGEQLDYWIGRCAGEDADPAAAIAKARARASGAGKERGLPARQSFYHRNKDKIWVGVILAVAGAILAAVVMVLVN